MKTTVEIVDSLFERAKTLAEREDTSLRSLVEEGLRRVLKARRAGRAFSLRRASFKGEGLAPEVAGDWARIRELAYEGRGGG